MSGINLSIAARCEAAGRDSNEDNYLVISDLGAGRMGFVANETISLGEKGTLLVVCDGMGGMNAGEVASEIAVQSVKSMFAVEKLNDAVVKSPRRYIEKVIKCADEAIKKQAKADSENKGMGTTIALLWLLDGKAFAGWCGDSRVYRYNVRTGLDRISHDHSYVQELVDAGSITEEMAFYHPQSNIITRSLGDTGTTANPETKEFYINEGDWFMLCSDGLCGNLQDSQIEAIMSQNLTNAKDCRDALWKADEEAEWHDNVTIIVVEVTDGGMKEGVLPDSSSSSVNHRTIITVLSVIVVVLAACLSYLLLNKNVNPPSEINSVTADTVPIVKADSTVKQIEQSIKNVNKSVNRRSQDTKQKKTNEQSISPDDVVTVPIQTQSQNQGNIDSSAINEISKDSGSDGEKELHGTDNEVNKTDSTKTDKLNIEL